MSSELKEKEETKLLKLENNLIDNLDKIAYTLDKAYLTQLTKDYTVYNFDEGYNKENIICYTNNIRALKVERWIFDKEEKSYECFKNVLSLFADGDHTLALVVKRMPTKSEMYFVIKNTGQARNEDSLANIELLNDSIHGNFPGTHTEIIEGGHTTREIFSFSEIQSIAVLVNTPSKYSNDYMTQGLEKLLNGIVPQSEEESYSVIFLAESLRQENIRDIMEGLEEMATSIYPFLSHQFQIGYNQTITQGEIESLTNSKGISDAIMKTHSVNVGINVGVNNAEKYKGLSFGYGYSQGKTHTESKNEAKTTSTNKSISIGQTNSTNYSYKSFTISNLLERLEKTMQRIQKSQATGLWRFSTYVLASDSKTSKNVANYLRAITQGKESYIEPTFIQEWSKENKNKTSSFSEIKKYVTHFTHPIFMIEDKEIIRVTPTAYVATDELSHVFAFPKKSVQGLPVLECVQFGREPHTLISTTTHLEIGCAYHMHEKIETQRILLSKEELTKHTFITGSTGSGKSNTIYKMLECLNEQKINFLVIEPTKGEYKSVFGKREGVTIYGTNPNLEDIQMLHINPFKFSKGIHILEHLDRVIEIFNVCWPMYAAMPAILKEAIERAYEMAGWDLAQSKNKYNENLFPTFKDILKQIKVVLEESDYSADNKGDYTGALITRIKSLTNGINGLIFTTDDIPDEQLFDQNVIVDLSRVGSVETKALIMGLLILKLNEYRAESSESNSKLRHVTVLEEAHHLLKRTSIEQVTEGANLLGKSVEMLANSIAEMRTYGEGFIIADQAPGLLDSSVIRNTNTKIILRLPDFSDRELVGKASGLNDNQIVELARLEKGVAVITQSDWLEPVLCKIDQVKSDNKDWKVANKDMKVMRSSNKDIELILLKNLMNKEFHSKINKIDKIELKQKIVYSNLDTSVKCCFIEYIDSEIEEVVSKFSSLIFEYFNEKLTIPPLIQESEIIDWANKTVNQLHLGEHDYTEEQINIVLAILIYKQAKKNELYDQMLIEFTNLYCRKGSVL